jgi:hypothetical protein
MGRGDGIGCGNADRPTLRSSIPWVLYGEWCRAVSGRRVR